MTKYIFLFLLLFSTSIFCQKKVLEHADIEIWNTINGERISPNGNYVLYSLEKGEKDQFLKINDIHGDMVFEHERANNGNFTYDSEFVLFNIQAWKDSVRAMKSRKIKKDDLPKDSLGILNLSNGSLTKIANVKSFKIPEKWSGYVAYELEEIKTEKDTDKDSLTEKKEKQKGKPKKVDKKNGYHVVLRNLETELQDTLKFVTDFIFAKKGKWFAYATTGKAKDSAAGVYVMDLESHKTTNVHGFYKAKYHQLNFSDSGEKLGFIVDTDTTKVQIRPNELYLWRTIDAEAKKMLDSNSAPSAYMVSHHGKIHFSKDESKFFFGLAKPPIIKDTTLIEDEIVNVEVWTYDEPRLYTTQEIQLKNDTILSYKTVINLKNNKLVQLGNSKYFDTDLGDEGNALYALTETSRPYELESQWTGRNAYDYRIVNTETGTVALEIKKAPQLRLSPKGKYAFGYSLPDSTWITYKLSNGAYTTLTKGKVFYDEQNDSPDFPSPYGNAGWTEDDTHIILYDRYDLWKVNPDTGKGIKLTSGRENKTVYRYVNLDEELRHIPLKDKWLLTSFNETTKDGGYASFDPKRNQLKSLLSGAYKYSKPIKAKLTNRLLFTRESFQEFPDLLVADINFKDTKTISHANPQQKEYNWGTIELVDWTSLDGEQLTGLLVKPENFDPRKKYPLLVNFYEKSADLLHKHRAPHAERSSLNYSFYTSRGYVIFNPDVHYRIGYPGESAYNCVIPGITSLVEKGFIDNDNIGVQGHSWGGYQIAYLVTKTDIFKAAESGAPVPNMISAYGGIRWWTGLSRQFQYEHTQSRIGGTPWEYPIRYIENSPIFNIDKINTPLLIMHNDADGHVPWYQGIEFFVSLRRLGKPAWFLNYNGEPHWPLKLQNRKDFNIRMAQFFDHYLKGASKPQWMERGVPAIEKGIKHGYELLENEVDE
ncbi:MAG: prolyl oligopeptidase family serine peptidase [Maribacter sp.]|uniref:alpha/beta hydrolase family protein n=1 Tax=Maribacter sp. TaxID=1897614 RepID=UPI003C73D353